MPYTDFGGFGLDYFEGDAVANPPGGHPAGYSKYSRATLPFDAYATLLVERLLARGHSLGQKVLVAGCGYGYTVEALVQDHGVDAYGLDLSPYAVGQAPASVADRIFQGDATSPQALRSVRRQTPGGRFAVVFAEALYSTMTDAEAQAAAAAMRGEAQQTLAVRVWATDAGPTIDPEWYNAKPVADWQALTDPDGQDEWMSEHQAQTRAHGRPD